MSHKRKNDIVSVEIPTRFKEFITLELHPFVEVKAYSLPSSLISPLSVRLGSTELRVKVSGDSSEQKTRLFAATLALSDKAVMVIARGGYTYC